MSLNAKAPVEKEFEKVPEGSHVARCVQVIDLGVQRVEWAGKEKLQPKVFIRWEIPSERIQFTDKEGKEHNVPMSISKKYTLSLSEKANLRADLESWRGKAFTMDELDGFNIQNLVGVPCMLSIVHNPSKDGTKVFANVASVMKLPKGMEAPAQESPSVVYDMDNHDQAVYDSLPEFLRKQIDESVKEDNNGEIEYPDEEIDASQIPF